MRTVGCLFPTGTLPNWRMFVLVGTHWIFLLNQSTFVKDSSSLGCSLFASDIRSISSVGWGTDGAKSFPHEKPLDARVSEYLFFAYASKLTDVKIEKPTSGFFVNLYVCDTLKRALSNALRNWHITLWAPLKLLTQTQSRSSLTLMWQLNAFKVGLDA